MNKKQGLVLIGIIGIIILIAMITLLMGDDEDNKENMSQNLSSENETITEDNSTENSEQNTVQQESSEEITTEEITTEEQTTEQIVVPVEYPYLIKVNRIANCVTVYAKDSFGAYTVPYKAITVSCGKIIEDTPLGEFNTIISYDWRLMFDGTYGHYAYRIVGSTLFHSVPYYTASNDDLEWMEYNKLGSPASLGCVRMTVADAKWLVENCPVGTKVIIYDDINNPGPLGKPETIKIPENSPHRGWDPTDPNPNNPWHNYSASIEYPSSKTIKVQEGATWTEVIANLKAKDTCGNDITDKIKVTGIYNLDVSGNYQNILFSVVDAIGSRAEVKLTILVEKREEPTTEEIIDIPEDDIIDVPNDDEIIETPEDGEIIDNPNDDEIIDIPEKDDEIIE